MTTVHFHIKCDFELTAKDCIAVYTDADSYTAAVRLRRVGGSTRWCGKATFPTDKVLSFVFCEIRSGDEDTIGTVEAVVRSLMTRATETHYDGGQFVTDQPASVWSSSELLVGMQMIRLLFGSSQPATITRYSQQLNRSASLALMSASPFSMFAKFNDENIVVDRMSIRTNVPGEPVFNATLTDEMPPMVTYQTVGLSLRCSRH
jgi:hypothetical protein